MASEERKRPPKDWEGVVDQAIRDAVERGEFQNLPGEGEPLALDDNPYTPRDLRLAFKLLKDAGATLDWIEEGNVIRAEQGSLAAWLAAQPDQLRRRARELRRLSPDKMIVEHRKLQSLEENIIAQYRERASELNRLIDNFNLKVPSSRLQQSRISIEQAIEQFRDDCRNKWGCPKRTNWTAPIRVFGGSVV